MPEEVAIGIGRFTFTDQDHAIPAPKSRAASNTTPESNADPELTAFLFLPFFAHCDRYSKDAVAFTREQLHLDPDHKQTQILDLSTQYGILNCTRQWGKSTMTAARAIHEALFKERSLTLVSAPSLTQASELVLKARDMLTDLGVKVKISSLHKGSIVLPNKSRILPLPNRVRTTRGYSKVSLILFDEAAHIPDENYYALDISRATAPNSTVWIMSTHGKRGFFYDTWLSTERWTKIQATVEECPRISPEFVALKRRQLPYNLFRQEFYCEFGDSQQSVLSTEKLLSTVTPEIPSLFPRRLDEQPTFPPRTTTPYPGIRYIIGVDLAQQQDYTAVAILESFTLHTNARSPLTYDWISVKTNHLRYLERLPLYTPFHEIADYLRHLVRRPELSTRCELVVDASGVGAPVIEMLRRSDLGAELTPVVITGGKSESTGRNAHRVPRLDLLQGLFLAIETQKLRIAKDTPATNDLIHEIGHLELTYSPTGRVSYQTKGENTHDDLTIAAALAWWKTSRLLNQWYV